MDPLEALCDNGLYAEQQGAFRCPVTARAGSVLLARHDDKGRAFLFVLCRSIENARLSAIGQLPGKAALNTGNQLIFQADIGESAAHHDLVVAAPGTIGVEIRRADTAFPQVDPGRAAGQDRAGR